MSTVFMAHSSFGKTRQSISPKAPIYSTFIIFWLHLILLLNHSLIYIHIFFLFYSSEIDSMKSIFFFTKIQHENFISVPLIVSLFLHAWIEGKWNRGWTQCVLENLPWFKRERENQERSETIILETSQQNQVWTEEKERDQASKAH